MSSASSSSASSSASSKKEKTEKRGSSSRPKTKKSERDSGSNSANTTATLSSSSSSSQISGRQEKGKAPHPSPSLASIPSANLPPERYSPNSSSTPVCSPPPGLFPTPTVAAPSSAAAAPPMGSSTPIPSSDSIPLFPYSGGTVDIEVAARERRQAEAQSSSWVRLNVGGTVFATTKSTLCFDPTSMLAALFDPNSPFSSTRDSDGAFLFDRDPTYFRVVLNFLRTGKLRIDQHLNVDGVRDEAEFFQVQSLLDAIRPKEICDLSRHEIISNRKNIQSFAGLRLMGLDLSFLNFKNENFSRADMRHCNFSHAKLQMAKLAHVNAFEGIFEYTRLAKADLREAVFRNARFSGANMVQAILCSSDLRHAKLAKADCTGALFQKAVLVGADLSCSILKQAKFQNCDLRHANFSLADLSEAHFTGADLRGATLNWEDWEDHCYFRNAIVTHHQYNMISMSKSAKRELRLTVIDDDKDLDSTLGWCEGDEEDATADVVDAEGVENGRAPSKMKSRENFTFFIVKGTQRVSSGKQQVLSYLNVRDAPGGVLIGRIDEGTRVRAYPKKSMVCVKGLYWQKILILVSDQPVLLRGDQYGTMVGSASNYRRVGGEGNQDEDDGGHPHQQIHGGEYLGSHGGEIVGTFSDEERSYISPEEEEDLRDFSSADENAKMSVGRDGRKKKQSRPRRGSDELRGKPLKKPLFTFNSQNNLKQMSVGEASHSGAAVGMGSSSSSAGGDGNVMQRSSSFNSSQGHTISPHSPTSGLHMLPPQAASSQSTQLSQGSSSGSSSSRGDARPTSPSSPLMSASSPSTVRASKRGDEDHGPTSPKSMRLGATSPGSVHLTHVHSNSADHGGRRVTWAIDSTKSRFNDSLEGWVPAIYLRREI